MLTEYKFHPAQISLAAQAAAQALASSNPAMRPERFAAETIGARVQAKPRTYLQYGPYWWAVKAAMREQGLDLGPADDPALRWEYGGDLPGYSRFIAGEQFRDFYNATFLAGTSTFVLDANGESPFTLFDPDMEVRALGGSARVVADLQAAPEPDGVMDPAMGTAGVLDGVADAAPALAPFAVKFEHDVAVWTAHLYAESREAAEAKLDGLIRIGRIGRAVDASDRAMAAVLDGADAALPLHVDRTQRTVCEMAPQGA